MPISQKYLWSSSHNKSTEPVKITYHKESERTKIKVRLEPNSVSNRVSGELRSGYLGRKMTMVRRQQIWG